MKNTFNLVWVILIEAFDDHRDALATTDTGCCEAMFLVSAFQFVKQGDHQTRPGCAQRVPQRDRAAIDVYLFAIQPKFLLDSEILCGKGFVHLN